VEQRERSSPPTIADAGGIEKIDPRAAKSFAHSGQIGAGISNRWQPRPGLKKLSCE